MTKHVNRRGDTPARPSPRSVNLLGHSAAASTPPPRHLSTVTYQHGRPRGATIAAAFLRPLQQHSPSTIRKGRYFRSGESPLPLLSSPLVRCDTPARPSARRDVCHSRPVALSAATGRAPPSPPLVHGDLLPQLSARSADIHLLATNLARPSRGGPRQATLAGRRSNVPPAAALRDSSVMKGLRFPPLPAARPRPAATYVAPVPATVSPGRLSL